MEAASPCKRVTKLRSSRDSLVVISRVLLGSFALRRSLQKQIINKKSIRTHISN